MLDSEATEERKEDWISRLFKLSDEDDSPRKKASPESAQKKRPKSTAAGNKGGKAKAKAKAKTKKASKVIQHMVHPKPYKS